MFPGFGVGGAQARFCAVANHHGRALRHAIIAMDGNVACRDRLHPGLDVSFPALTVAKDGLFGTIARLRAVLRDLRPDVLLTHNWGSIEWALANAPPLASPLARHVHVEDGFGPEERDRQLPRRVWMRRLALRRSTIVLPSNTLLRLARTIWRLDPARLRYVPNGVDLSRFGPAETRPSGEPLTVGTVAALRPEKNIFRLLAAVAATPRVRLVVVGDGPDRAALTDRAAALGLTDRVVFAGHTSDPAPAYRDMDVFALSSDTEQMPLSVLEAMAAGLPVAATDVGDVRDMLAPENRPFVVARDDAALAGALARLAADPALRHALGRANREKAARDFDQAGMFAAWGGLLGA